MRTVAINTAYRSAVRIALATAFILVIPLAAMQFSDQWNWDLFDFVFAGVLLFGTGLAYDLIARKSDNSANRFSLGIAVVSALLLIWINAAVGIIGEPGGPNLMYFGVLAVGFIGALIARFRPHGMTRALFMTAIAQMFVPVIALVIAKPQITLEPPGVAGYLVSTHSSPYCGSVRLYCFDERRMDDPNGAWI